MVFNYEKCIRIITVFCILVHEKATEGFVQQRVGKMARVILSRRISFAKNIILAAKLSFRSSPLRQAAGRYRASLNDTTADTNRHENHQHWGLTVLDFKTNKTIRGDQRPLSKTGRNRKAIRVGQFKTNKNEKDSNNTNDVPDNRSYLCAGLDPF